MIEPMDCINSREYEAVVFVGPARTGKTYALSDCAISYYIDQDPSDLAVFLPSQANARDYSIRRIDRLIKSNDQLREKLVFGQGDNVYDKHFKAGNILTVAWPSDSQLRQREFKIVILSDYDAMTISQTDEGSIFARALKRTQTYLSAGMTIVDTSPGYTINTDVEVKSGGHWAPYCEGSLQIYNQGDRRKLYWTCPNCKDPFSPLVEYLKYEEKSNHLETAETTVLECPHCSHVMTHADKIDLQKTTKWYRDGELEGNPVKSTIASFWMEGVAAAFQSWSQLVYRELVAKEAYDATGNWQAWQATVNIDQGRPFLIPKLDKGRDTFKLSSRAEDTEKRTVPDGVKFLTCAVDQQKNRFVVQVEGWGVNGECWIIDRYNLQHSQRLQADGSPYPIEPFVYAEDWAVLKRCAEREYTGQNRNFLPVLTLIDSGGGDKATENAYKFWRLMQKEGLGERFALVKGLANTKGNNAKRVFLSDVIAKNEKVKLYLLNVNMLKDEIDRDLNREVEGDGFIHFPQWLGDWFYHELSAEIRTPQGWVKRSKKQNNEAFDLLGYNKAAAIILGIETIDWDSPPSFVEGESDSIDFTELARMFKK